MINYLASLVALKADRRAVTALEYGLIAALIAGAIVTVVGVIGTNLTTTLTTLSGKI
jgi:pilus assembly protein Flp/PilA